MRIVCATNMPFAAEAFATLGDVTVKDGRTLTAADVRDADLLAVRSTTKVNAALLAGSRVRFVGTATIGTDHLDIPYLDRQGIRWCYAPGCNADSVADYFCAALLHVAQRHGFTLADRTLAVIGYGNVGRRVAARALALGLSVRLNDPPLARAGSPPPPPLKFEPLADVLAAADIVTLHVPLTRTGPDATHHLAGDAFFAQFKPGALFVNAARGAIVDTDALRRARAAGRVAHAIMDTWEGEPAYRHDLLPHADIATPHIAGYSYDGRVNGSIMVYRAACEFLGRSATWSPAGRLPPPPVPHIELDAAGRPAEAVLHELCRRVYDIAADDARLRASVDDDPARRAAAFDALRKHYPERREFAHTRVRLHHAPPDLLARVRNLGFNLA